MEQQNYTLIKHAKNMGNSTDRIKIISYKGFQYNQLLAKYHSIWVNFILIKLFVIKLIMIFSMF